MRRPSSNLPIPFNIDRAVNLLKEMLACLLSYRTLSPYNFRIVLGSLEPPRKLRSCLKVHYGKRTNTGAQIFNRRAI